jgi:hypothetical protein
MPKIWKKPYTPLVSSFSGMLSIKISLFLLPNVNDLKKRKKLLMLMA